MQYLLIRSSASLLLAATLAAQTPPDAGALSRRIEDERAKAPEPRQAKPLEAPAPLRPPAGLSVTVRAFRFAGNKLLDADTLAAATAPFLNRTLDFAQLQAAAAAVAARYRQAGWIVRSYLPAQEIRDGIVTLQIVEARFGHARAEGEPQRLPAARALAYVNAQQRAGQALSAAALERAVLLVDDLPGITATGALEAGHSDGETDLVLKLADEALLTGDVTLDNTGSRSTGAARAVASLRLNSPARIGDRLQLNALATQGSGYARVEYSLPLGLDGLRVGANAGAMNYHLVGADFAALDARGTARSAGLSASWPILRGRETSIYLAANADTHRYDNTSGGATTSHYGTRTLAASVYARRFDAAGSSFASLAWTAGVADLDGSPNQPGDAATTRVAGRYDRLNASIARQQRLRSDLMLFGQFSGQWADRNLDSSEKFYLGGIDGVRAYPANEAGGASGALLKLELRWRARPELSVGPFVDYGHVEVDHHNGYPGASAPNRYHLAGAGLSAAWTSTTGLVLNATWAHRIGSNAGATATGRDQDGSLVRNRLWLVATLPFAH